MDVKYVEYDGMMLFKCDICKKFQSGEDLRCTICNISTCDSCNYGLGRPIISKDTGVFECVSCIIDECFVDKLPQELIYSIKCYIYYII